MSLLEYVVHLLVGWVIGIGVLWLYTRWRERRAVRASAKRWADGLGRAPSRDRARAMAATARMRHLRRETATMMDEREAAMRAWAGDEA